MSLRKTWLVVLLLCFLGVTSGQTKSGANGIPDKAGPRDDSDILVDSPKALRDNGFRGDVRRCGGEKQMDDEGSFSDSTCKGAPGVC